MVPVRSIFQYSNGVRLNSRKLSGDFEIRAVTFQDFGKFLIFVSFSYFANFFFANFFDKLESAFDSLIETASQGDDGCAELRNDGN